MVKLFEYIGTLQCENRIPRKKIADYESGERFKQFQTEHLLFLHDTRMPTTNNTAAHYLRDHKRKQTFAMTFRSLESIEELCHSKGVRLEYEKTPPNIYTSVMEIFNQK